MDSSLFNVHHSASVSGPVSANSVSVSASTSSIPAATGHLLPGAGHVDAVEEDDVSLDSNASTADHHNQHQQSDPDPGAGSGAGPVAPWLANIKRRAPIACRRCRRQRSKCEHDKAKPPCKSCKEAGLGADECIFPVRGQPGNDREYRHPRQRAPKGSKSAANVQDGAAVAGVAEGRAAPRPRNPPNPSKPEDVWKSMPPKEDILDAVDRFTSNYFQLSFISKKQFRDRLQNDHKSVEPFLLLGILGISARMTPALIKAHGSGLKAAEYFTSKQFDIASREIYMGPTLERCQAFYLLSLAQQGSGLKNVSYLNVGIATRMSTLMQLHREETYEMQNPTVESIISAESARRTMWMLHSQDSLHSGPQSPVTLGAPDITTLLPCSEEDFVAGRQPRSRAALPDSPPAIEKPHLVRDPGRSLFASLMQIHHYWGIVSRRAASFAREPSPWDSQSEFINMKTKLDDWEDGLAAEHRWSESQLHYYKRQGLDLSYTNMTMMLRLCNILLRRPYMADMMVMYSKSVHEQSFFAGVAADMFRNVSELYEQIDAQFTGRSVNENVGAQITAFCVYVCGLFSTYACRYPNLCPDKAIVERGPAMVKRTKQILSECDRVWPLASRWVESLERTYNHPYKPPLMNEGGMTDAKDTVPQAWLKKSITVPKVEPDTVPAQMTTDIAQYPAHQQPHAQMLSHQQAGLAAYHSTPVPPSFPPVIDMHTPTQSQAAALPYASQPHLSNILPQQTQPPDQLYIPSHPPAGDMGMMMSSPFQSTHPQPPPQSAGYMVNHAGSGFYHQGHHGPSNDGFEDELQFYMGDKDGPSLPTSWSGPF